MAVIKHIIQGWYNDFIKKPQVERKAQYKLSICNSCPSLDTTGTKCSLPNSRPCCGECGCPISKKTRSDSPCPLGKF